MSLIKAVTNNTNLTNGAIQTFLTDNVASGSSTITVKNITGFAINQILVIGNFGNEGAELIKTHAATAPTGSTITLASNTVFPHSSSDPVIVIDFDQVEFSHATTVGGTPTVLSTVTMAVDTPDFTRYNDTTYTTGYYYIRFKNSITLVFSDYSDPIPVSGYGINSARSVIDSALSEINKSISETLTDDFSFQQLDNCQTECLRELKRWSFMQKFNQDIGSVSTGSWKVTIPTDLDDENTNKSIFNLRLGRNPRLTYVDKEKFDELMLDMAFSTLEVALVALATTMTLVDSSDFDDEGSVTIGDQTYNYTANDKTTGILTLSTTITSSNAQPINSDVFQGAQNGLPQYWTIFGGNIYYLPITAEAYDGKNLILDYYIKQTKITGDYDELIIPDQTVAVYYLCWKFLKKLNSGEETEGSLAYRDLYIARREKMKQKEVSGKTFKLRPRLQNFSVQSQFDENGSKKIRTGNFENTGF